MGSVLFKPSPRYLRFSNDLPWDDRIEFGRAVEAIGRDPEVDGITKIAFFNPPFVFRTYLTSRYWLAYRVTTDVSTGQVWVELGKAGLIGTDPSFR